MLHAYQLGSAASLDFGQPPLADQLGGAAELDLLGGEQSGVAVPVLGVVPR